MKGENEDIHREQENRRLRDTKINMMIKIIFIGMDSIDHIVCGVDCV